MLKTGKYRAFRNIPAGWVLQAIHSTDSTERLFRIIMELLLIIGVYFLLAPFALEISDVSLYGVVIFIGHTLSWCFTGNFWVYLLDSFLVVKNPGINKVLDFCNLTKSVFNYFDCAEEILIYGSMCRDKFHGRSDLDLRVIRRTDSIKGLLALPLGYLLRVYSFFIVMPVDLQVVDSLGFLNQQMRSDEKPIIVFSRGRTNSITPGRGYDTVLKNPTLVLKKS